MWMIKSASCLIFGLFLISNMRIAKAASCDLNQKQILFSYYPQICIINGCEKSQKIVVLGSKLLSYFKDGGVDPDFLSLGVGVSNEQRVNIGFEYDFGENIDALSDAREQAGLDAARSSLSPGSRYQRYTLRAFLENEILKLQNEAVIDLPYIGSITSEIETSIDYSNCTECKASVLVTTVTPNGSRSNISLRTGYCQIETMQ